MWARLWMLNIGVKITCYGFICDVVELMACRFAFLARTHTHTPTRQIANLIDDNDRTFKSKMCSKPTQILHWMINHCEPLNRKNKHVSTGYRIKNVNEPFNWLKNKRCWFGIDSDFLFHILAVNNKTHFQKKSTWSYLEGARFVGSVWKIFAIWSNFLWIGRLLLGLCLRLRLLHCRHFTHRFDNDTKKASI